MLQYPANDFFAPFGVIYSIMPQNRPARGEKSVFTKNRPVRGEKYLKSTNECAILVLKGKSKNEN